MDIKLWKPLINKNQSIVFDVFGYRDNGSYNPILIYEDKELNHFYYVVAKPINVNQDLEMITDEQLGSNVLVRYTLETGIINNYIVDCSQIFRIDKTLLEDIIDENLHKSISPINQYYIERISETIYSCLLASPPYLSLLAISYDQDSKAINTYSIYINDLILDYFNSDSSGYEIVDRNIYRSVPSVVSEYWNERYENGIKFCRYFLNNFYNEQDLTKFNQNEQNRYKMLIIKEKASDIIKEREYKEIYNSIPTQVLDLNDEAVSTPLSNDKDIEMNSNISMNKYQSNDYNNIKSPIIQSNFVSPKISNYLKPNNNINSTNVNNEKINTINEEVKVKKDINDNQIIDCEAKDQCIVKQEQLLKNK